MKHSVAKVIARVRSQASAIGLRLNRMKEGTDDAAVAQAEAALQASRDVLQAALHALAGRPKGEPDVFEAGGFDD